MGSSAATLPCMVLSPVLSCRREECKVRQLNSAVVSHWTLWEEVHRLLLQPLDHRVRGSVFLQAVTFQKDVSNLSRQERMKL